MIRYTICHNDDDPDEPNHRRVEIGIIKAAYDENKLVIVADGEPVDIAPVCDSEAEAEAAIQAIWGVPYWDLRRED